MVLTNVLSPLHFSSVLLTRASLKDSQNLWPNSHVLQSFHYTENAVFGTHFFASIFSFEIRKSPQIVISSAAEMLWRNQPIIANNPSKGGANATLHCTGPSAIQNLPIRFLDGKNTCSSKWAIPFLQFLQPLKIRHLLKKTQVF